MIDRRTLLLGGGLSLLAGAARAEIRINGHLLPPDRDRFKDAPITDFEDIPNHRQMMRDIIVALSGYAKSRNPGFGVLVRDAPELLIKGKREWDWETGRDLDGASDGKYTPVGTVIRPYLNAIDGILADGLFYGRDKPNQPTDADSEQAAFFAAQVLRKEGRTPMSIEYASGGKEAADAARRAGTAKILTHVDMSGTRTLSRVPHGYPPAENPNHITSLKDARNFLPLFRSTAFGSPGDWVAAMAATNYDLLIIDPLFRGNQPLTARDIEQLKQKRIGSRRLVYALLSVGRAEDTRPYWKKEWKVGSPPWLAATDPDISSETIVQFWDAAWKDIVGRYLQGMIDLGLDGVLFDYADVYTWFEDMMPLK
ncbi:MAG: hypothetical protein F8N37_19260 [Telmatospirillum sp.]|nr:hypothetical protein [Telmatospirillum sp.]